MAKKDKDTVTRIEHVHTPHVARVRFETIAPHAMFLRQSLAHGTADDGRPIAVDLTGPSIVITLGDWGKEGSHQLIVNVIKLTQDLLSSVDPASVKPAKELSDAT